MGWFLTAEIIRHVFPIVLVLALLGGAFWLTTEGKPPWASRVVGLTAIVGGLTAIARLAYRWRWEIRAGLPRTAVAAAGLGLLSVLGAAGYLLTR